MTKLYEKILPVNRSYNIRVSVSKAGRHFNVHSSEWIEANNNPPLKLASFECENLIRTLRKSCSEHFSKQLYSLYDSGKMIKDSKCYGGTIFFGMYGFKKESDANEFAESLTSSFKATIDEISKIEKFENDKMTVKVNFQNQNEITQDELDQIIKLSGQIASRAKQARDNNELMLGGIYWRAAKILSAADNYLDIYEDESHAETLRESHGVLADYDAVQQVLAELEHLGILPNNWEQLAKEKRQVMDKALRGE